MALTPLTIRTSNGEATVTAEQVSEHFALTPLLTYGDPADGGNGFGLRRGALALRHIGTARSVSADQFIDLRKVAVELEKLTIIDWDTLTLDQVITEAQSAAISEAFTAVRADSSGPRWPWPNWAGEASTPATSLIAHMLDSSLTLRDRLDSAQGLIARVAGLDEELGRSADVALTGSIMNSYVGEFGVIWLLSSLQRLDTEAADRAARFLIGQWDAGDSLGEWTYQWRQELADGTPLTLPEIPHHTGLTDEHSGQR